MNYWGIKKVQTYGAGKRYFMSEDKKNEEIKENKESVAEEKDNSKEDYTFVRETIKERPAAFVRMLFKAGKLLGMGVAFGLGVCLVILIFNKDMRNIFTKDKDSNKESTENAADYTDEGSTSLGEETMSFDEKTGAQLAEVVVIYYSKEEATALETESSNESGGADYDEEVTADISDNKEIQTTTSQADKSTEKRRKKESTGDGAATGSENKRIEEKKHYTGLIVAAVGDVFICIENGKINKGEDILVSFGDGNYVKAGVYGSDLVNGLAVLRVYAKDIDEKTKKKLKPAIIRSIDEMNEGDKLVYVGNPYGTGRLMYTGALAGVDDGHCNYDTFYRGVVTDIRNEDIQDGFMFDANGDIVAMVGSINEKLTLGKNIAGVCMEDIMFIVSAIVDGSYVKHIGIKGEAVTDDMRELTGESMPDGMYVTDVARDSSAYRSGIMVGDIVISVNGNQVSKLKDIQMVLEKTSENADITLVVKRRIGTSYNEITIKVPVEASVGIISG